LKFDVNVGIRQGKGGTEKKKKLSSLEGANSASDYARPNSEKERRGYFPREEGELEQKREREIKQGGEKG